MVFVRPWKTSIVADCLENQGIRCCNLLWNFCTPFPWNICALFPWNIWDFCERFKLLCYPFPWNFCTPLLWNICTPFRGIFVLFYAE
jgi:hypothetical protein